MRIFGYGSLIFSPELPGEVQGQRPARLPGYRRTFNKISSSRFCARSESYDAFAAPHPCFLQDGVYRSLVLGTASDPDAEMIGMLIEYPSHAVDRVLVATDRREGYDAERTSRENAYLRSERTVEALENNEPLSCLIYLTNPDPSNMHRAPPLSVDEKARVLINATPRERRGRAPAEDSRGLYYLEGVRTDLRSIGIIDPDLEELAAAIHDHPGPWTASVAPPQS